MRMEIYLSPSRGAIASVEIKGLGQPVASVTLTPPPPPVPPMGVPCPIIAPPPAFAGNTNFCAEPLAGTTPTSAFTLTNNSNAALAGIAITTIGLAPSGFRGVVHFVHHHLNAGSSCLINVGVRAHGYWDAHGDAGRQLYGRGESAGVVTGGHGRRLPDCFCERPADANFRHCRRAPARSCCKWCPTIFSPAP